ncbi:hypothetical protein DRQ33_01250 [bacterium]|nr:MAG: hypothetical protein DRQ33_01250 [bacterium]
MKYAIILIILFTSCFSQISEDSLWAIWDTTYLYDATSLDVETLWVDDTTFAGVDFNIGEIRYTSRGVDDVSIRIQAYFADPGESNVPGVIVGHGNGGEGSLELALGTAVGFQSFVLSISGPGCGDSEGAGSDPINWINTVPNVKNSWIFQYSVSAIRGMTYLLELPQIDSNLVGYTGASAGGIMTFLASAVDRRCAFSFPLLASGEWELAAECPNAWFLLAAGDSISIEDERVVRLCQHYDPTNYIGWHNIPTLAIIGAQDEFFPIYALSTFWESYAHSDARLLVVANFDHAVYYANDEGEYDSFNNSETFAEKTLYTTSAFWYSIKEDIPIPETPQVEAEFSAGTLRLTAEINPALTTSVKAWISVDSGWTFQNYEMSGSYITPYQVDIPLPDGFDLSNTIYFVEANGLGYYLTSIPYVPIPVRLRPLPIDRISAKQNVKTQVSIYPNPFNSVCMINLPDNMNYIVEIMDVSGKVIRRWEQQSKILWEGYDETRHKVPSGIYLLKIDDKLAGKIIFMK